MISLGIPMVKTFVRHALPVFILSVVTLMALALICSASPAFAKHKHLTQAAHEPTQNTATPQHPVPSYCAPSDNNPVDMPAGGWKAVASDQNPRCPNGTSPYLIYSPSQTNAAPATPPENTGGSH